MRSAVRESVFVSSYLQFRKHHFLLESVKQTHPLRSSLLLQIENTFVLCFHQETSESRARDSVTEAGETLQCEREILLFILLVSHVPSVFVTDVTSLFCRSVMPWSTRVALLMLLIGQISTGPETSSSSNPCQGQKALHERMDSVEKRLDEGVQKLQAELALLLEAVEAREWSPLLDEPRIDILDEPPAP
ncbi:hypothetical protein ABG768_005994 [Culter alburnus]|uniref:Placenta-specific protein 9 n=1 Tax=Culter alburnus TaxID=194366 RepID=A0AAW1ZU55_CULAL